MTAAIVPARDLARLTDVQLLKSYYQDHEVAVRDELVRRFMPFGRKLAVRYLHSREPLDDLVQVANLGLLNAIDRFEPGRGRSFTAYAAPTILGELKRHSRDKSWSVHVPRELKERALGSSRHRERLYVELGRCPTVDELADAPLCTIAQTIEALDAAENDHPQSLDAPGGDDGEDRMPLLEFRRRIRARRGSPVPRCQLENAQRHRTPDRRAAAPPRPHAAGDQPARRMLTDARVAPPEQVDPPPQHT
jgi:RNA polymerase sigma factor (sigma-70 family)